MYDERDDPFRPHREEPGRPNDATREEEPSEPEAPTWRVPPVAPSPQPAPPVAPSPRPAPAGPTIRFEYAPPPETEPPPPKQRIGANVVLFILTLGSSIYWGFLQYQQFYSEELRGLESLNPFSAPEAFLGGLPFGVAVIAILLAHEMGHYLACRYYGIAATLPYFIPLPPVIPTLLPGTMGAVIRIKGAITSRRALFDIAVAGPIAGWVTALPILAYGLSQSRVVEQVTIETSPTGAFLTLGEPLIWPFLSALFAPEVGPTQDLVVHPLAFVGWFALLITAMNLLPVGQLDGGHLLYTLVPRLHRVLSFSVLGLMLYAGFRYFPGWIVFAAVVSLLFLVGGMRHPKPIKYRQSLGAARVMLLFLALAIFVTSFMLVPVELPPLVR